jgi:hypothetical protein
MNNTGEDSVIAYGYEINRTRLRVASGGYIPKEMI